MVLLLGEINVSKYFVKRATKKCTSIQIVPIVQSEVRSSIPNWNIII